MRLRIRTTESVLLVAGLIGLLEQEAVRVLLGTEPSVLISGICLLFVLIGAGVAVIRNVSIGPFEIEMGQRQEEEPDESEKTTESQPQ